MRSLLGEELLHLIGYAHRLAGLVDETGVGQLVLLRIGVLDIADRVGQAVHKRGNTFVALATSTDRPVDRRALAHLGLPLGVDLREVVREQEGSSRAVGAAHHLDLVVGQGDPGVQPGDRGVVPLRDLADEIFGRD